MPKYLMSGIKGKSHIQNIQTHSKNTFFLLIDIKNYYPSITKSKIKSSLIRNYQQSSNVAECLSNIVTIKQKSTKERALPTGSPLSQDMAYFINKKMFDELYDISQQYSVVMTVYFDDISFSSRATIPYKFVKQIIYTIKKYGYSIATRKLYYGKMKSKKNINTKNGVNITGAQFTKYGLFLTATQNKKIKNKRDLVISKQKSGILYTKELNSLLASISQAIMINPKYRRYQEIIKKFLG